MKFQHTGHIGDIIAFLPLFKAMGGKKLYVKDDPGMAPMKGFKFDTMAPLLRNQGIDVEYTVGPNGIDVDMTQWRHWYRDDISLIDSQARCLGLVHERHGHFEVKKPWITVDPDPNTEKRVIFNRTPRYRNPAFPWKELLEYFGDRALFVGTPEEHEIFKREVGQIERYKTADCLAVARAIKGSDYFVGNQSSAFWLAAAMFHPLLQEVDLIAANSMVLFPGATYCRDGKVDFTSLL